MELRAYALRLLETPSLAARLTPPDHELTDEVPGPALRLDAPARPAELQPRAGVRVPPLAGLPDPEQRLRIVHAFVNHELQAVELFAWALLAFPEAPGAFRRGLLATLLDEQRHARLYLDWLEARGARFGRWPVSDWFWTRMADVHTPLEFVCAMALTFENANLDHTLDYARAARELGEDELADVLDVVHADEVRHVAFGVRWLDAFKAAGQSRADAYEAGVRWPLRWARARGPRMHRAPREAAGLDPESLARLEAASDRDRGPDDGAA